MAKDYHFNIGDSETERLGMCGVVRAESREEAVELVNTHLPETVELKKDLPDEFQYWNIYINTSDLFMGSDIDEETDI